jgi:hypothetical protein
MSARLKKFASYLCTLHRASPKLRKTLLQQNCSSEFLRCLSECAKNVLNGNVELTSEQKKQLLRRKRLLRKLVLKKTSLKTKKKIAQTGGFLGALLAPIIKILGGLFGATSS